MDIAINGRYLTQRLTGVQRFATEVVTALDQMISEGDPAMSGIQLRLITPKGPRASTNFRNIEIIEAGKSTGHAWEQLELPKYTGNSLLLNLCNTGPLIVRNQALVLHDTAVFAMPSAFSQSFRWSYRLLLPPLTQRVKHLLTVSHFSKSEINRYLGVPLEKIIVIPEGHEHIKRMSSDDRIIIENNLREKPFVLAVSSLNPSKNFSALTEAITFMTDNSFDIVIAGGTNPAIFDASNSAHSSRVRYLGYVTDEELKALYMHATAFVHPSLYEGFGLTPLEALALGNSVIASDIPPLREVCGQAAKYVDPRNPGAIAYAITCVMTNPELRTALARAAPQQLRQFSWRSSALALVSAINT